MWRNWNSYTLLVANVKRCSSFRKQYGGFSKNSKYSCYRIQQSHAGICSNKLKSEPWRDTCIPIFIAALVMIAKIWNQPKYLSRDEWVKKMGCVHTVEYYAALKKEICHCNMDEPGGWSKLDITGHTARSHSHEAAIMVKPIKPKNTVVAAKGAGVGMGSNRKLSVSINFTSARWVSSRLNSIVPIVNNMILCASEPMR